MEKSLLIYLICLFSGLIFSLAVTPPLIILLSKLKAGQILRKEGPSEHLVKSGTPTMGGVAIILPVLLLTLLFSGFSQESLIICVTVSGFFLIGFVDDFLIITKGKNDGLRPKAKLLLQGGTAALFATYLVMNGHESVLNIPFTGKSIDIGIFYIPFVVFIMTGFSNAVNLTDGLDGLASGTMIISLFPLLLMLIFAEKNLLTESGIYLALATIGCCAGYLWFNSYPASVFMGDTGSLALGGLFSLLAVIANNELWLIFAGFIFVIETLSVMIQVFFFKRTGRRVFLMSPLHHHFEKKGWRETKVSFRFYLVQLIASLITGIGFMLTRF